MKTIEGLYYSESHEWVKAEGDMAIIGITDYAQHAMGDIVYVDMPDRLAFNQTLLNAGVEVNEALEDESGLLNQDPYENWIIKVQMSQPDELDKLMNATDYAAFCENQ